MQQTFVLPFPLSTNAIWRAYRGRNILSRRYRYWREIAEAQLHAQVPKPIAGPVEILIELRPPDLRKRDPDNLVKCLFDLLKGCGVIEDDNLKIIRKFTVVWGSGFDGSRVTVTKFGENWPKPAYMEAG